MDRTLEPEHRIPIPSIRMPCATVPHSLPSFPLVGMRYPKLISIFLLAISLSHR